MIEVRAIYVKGSLILEKPDLDRIPNHMACEVDSPHPFPIQSHKKMAQDIKTGKIADDLWVVWCWTESKELAKELQDALITLFRRECKRQPQYNIKWEGHPQPETFESVYIDLKRQVGSLTGK